MLITLIVHKGKSLLNVDVTQNHTLSKTLCVCTVQCDTSGHVVTAVMLLPVMKRSLLPGHRCSGAKVLCAGLGDWVAIQTIGQASLVSTGHG